MERAIKSGKVGTFRLALSSGFCFFLNQELVRLMLSYDHLLKF